MGFKKRWLFAMLAGILALSLLAACAGGEELTPTEPSMTRPVPKPPPLPTPLEEISLEKAEAIMGVPLAPKYLPAGYEFQRCVVFSWGPPADFGLCFSDEGISEEAETTQDSSPPACKFGLNVSQVTKTPPPGFPQRAAELYGGEVVDIDGTKARLVTGPLGCVLSWFQPGLHFYMYVKVDLPEEEILKIARSIE